MPSSSFLLSRFVVTAPILLDRYESSVRKKEPLSEISISGNGGATVLNRQRRSDGFDDLLIRHLPHPRFRLSSELA